jgi:hypothetical protein
MAFLRRPLWKADITAVRDAGDDISDSSVPDLPGRLDLGLDGFPLTVRYILGPDISDLVVLELFVRSLGSRSWRVSSEAG